MTQTLDTTGRKSAGEWLTASESARRIGVSRSMLVKYASRFRILLGGRDFQRGRSMAVKYQADLVERYRCARERFTLTRLDARADMHAATTPTESSTSKEPRRGR